MANLYGVGRFGGQGVGSAREDTVRVLERLSVAVDAVTGAQPTPPSA